MLIDSLDFHWSGGVACKNYCQIFMCQILARNPESSALLKRIALLLSCSSGGEITVFNLFMYLTVGWGDLNW